MSNTSTNSSHADCVVADAARLGIFRTQVSEYCSHLMSALRAMEPSSSPRALEGIVMGAYRRFGLRCHLIEQILFTTSELVITTIEARRVLRRILCAIPLLFVEAKNARERVAQIVEWLAARNPDYPALLTIAHDSNWIEGRPRDLLMWEYARMKGPSITYRRQTLTKVADGVPKALVIASRPQMVLTKSQDQAARYLTHYYQLVSQGASLSGYTLRPPLLVGPSGSGKTSVARHVAMLLGRPLLEYDMGSWAPQGSRVEVGTIETIRRAMQEHGAVLIYVDELDKFSGRGQQWYATINQEIFSLIDRRTSGYANWDDSDRARLANAFVFAGGTFQHVFRKQDRSLGFGGKAPVEAATLNLADQTIPDELLYRFGKTILVEPPSPEEVAERIAWIRADLDLPVPEPAELARLVAEAIESRRGNRWLENFAADQLVEQTASPCWDRPTDDGEPTW